MRALQRERPGCGLLGPTVWETKSLGKIVTEKGVNRGRESSLRRNAWVPLLFAELWEVVISCPGNWGHGGDVVPRELRCR